MWLIINWDGNAVTSLPFICVELLAWTTVSWQQCCAALLSKRNERTSIMFLNNCNLYTDRKCDRVVNDLKIKWNSPFPLASSRIKLMIMNNTSLSREEWGELVPKHSSMICKSKVEVKEIQTKVSMMTTWEAVQEIVVFASSWNVNPDF